MVNYKGVNLPIEIIDQIDELVKDKKYGYSSRADFIRDAIRLKLKEFEES
jgi:metal-responsive CopG/Arc/MetJ family transcriptional regulator